MATREDRPTRQTTDRIGIPLVIGLAGVIIAAILLWAWLANDDDSAGPERGVTVEDVADADAFDDDGFADSLLGQQVTVSGKVSDMLAHNAVWLGGDDFGGDGILVIQVTAPGISEDDNVRVTGTVREFDAAAFEREFGAVDYNGVEYDPWRHENILVASTVTELDGGN